MVPPTRCSAQSIGARGLPFVKMMSLMKLEMMNNSTKAQLAYVSDALKIIFHKTRKDLLCCIEVQFRQL